MDYAQMMLAVEIRKIAESKYSAALALQNKQSNVPLDIARWKSHNTVMTFVPPAIEDLQQIATLLTPPPP